MTKRYQVAPANAPDQATLDLRNAAGTIATYTVSNPSPSTSNATTTTTPGSTTPAPVAANPTGGSANPTQGVLAVH